MNRARVEVVSNLLSEIAGALGLRGTLDVGCGLGYFSALLYSNGYQVTAVDGRAGNATEGEKRYPQGRFLGSQALCDGLGALRIRHGIQPYELGGAAAP